MFRTLKIAIILASSAFAVHTVSADVMYFMVGNPMKYNNGEEVAYTFATVSTDYGTTDYRELFGGGATESLGSALMADSTDPVYADIGSGYSQDNVILFELWSTANGETEKVGYKRYLISELGANIISDMSMMSGATPLVVNGVAPEPTSGLLVLLGFAGLALRRKRF